MAIRVPDNTNYVQIGSDGHQKFVGSATVFLDERGYLSGARLESPGSKLEWVNTESAFRYENGTTLADYLIVNTQRNHDARHGAVLRPHLHWEQVSVDMPNWMLQARYQKQGAQKTSAWTNIAWSSNAFNFTDGTLNQITIFPTITPPSGDNVSDIIQFRIIRDTNNDSGLFSGTESLGNMLVVDFDCHKELDSNGSNTEYGKE